jgi:UDP-N-acetylenolpyruvoylglucosamine reductase
LFCFWVDGILKTMPSSAVHAVHFAIPPTLAVSPPLLLTLLARRVRCVLTMAHKPAFGHLAPLLRRLRSRSGLTVRALAARAGLPAFSSLGQRLKAPGHLGTAAILDVARACGATPEELHRVRVLDALDRGALPLPEGVGEERVAAALAALEAAS